MAYTYSKIASVTVGSGGSSSIDFIAIPQNYTDLLLNLSGRIDTTFGNAWYDTYLRINSTAGTSRDVYGTGAVAQSGTDSGEIRILGVPSSGATASTFSNAFIYITNYASTTQNKSISIDSVSENNATASMAQLGAGIYSSSAAVTSLKLDPYLAGNFAQYSTATLYGIKAEV